MKHKTVLSFDELRDEFSNSIKPRTTNQKLYWDLLKDDTKSIVIAHGPAGSGKTLLATQNGIDLMKLQKIEKIVREALNPISENITALKSQMDELKNKRWGF